MVGRTQFISVGLAFVDLQFLPSSSHSLKIAICSFKLLDLSLPKVWLSLGSLLLVQLSMVKVESIRP